MNVLDSLGSLSMEIKVALGVIIAVQIVLDIIAFTDLYKRPAERLMFGNKWIWAAIILVVSTIGAVLYLAIGRKPADAAVEARSETPAAMRASGAADLLYGERKDAEKR